MDCWLWFFFSDTFPGGECLVDLENPGTGRSIRVKPNQIFIETNLKIFTSWNLRSEKNTDRGASISTA